MAILSESIGARYVGTRFTKADIEPVAALWKEMAIRADGWQPKWSETHRIWTPGVEQLPREDVVQVLQLPRPEPAV